MKKIILLSISVFLLIGKLLCQSGWFIAYTEQNMWPNSVYFYDNNTGYTVGGGKLLLKTTDAGQNWMQIVPMNFGMDYTHIHFTNSDTGIICGVYSGESPPNGFMQITKNGGYNWYSPETGLNGPIIKSLQFINSFTGFAAGYGLCTWGGGCYKAKYRTTDGGNTWIGIGSGYPDSCNYTSVHFLNYSTGYIARYSCFFPFQQSPNILKTTSGGATWSELLPGTWTQPINSIYFLNINTGFACSNGIIMTTNGGSSWNSVASGGIYRKIVFVSSDIGFCIGDSSSILKTTNGGFNWYSQISPIEVNYKDCFFTSVNTGYIIGSNSQMGVILKTTNGGGNFVNTGTLGNEIPLEYKLFQNYPNPFNPVTNIKFDLPDASEVKLTVFDILGREIKVLVNEFLKRGIYRVDWDASNYPSGTYLYSITAGNFTETKKMVLIK